MRLSKGFLLTLVAALLVLSAMLVKPFLQYILGAVLLAFVLYPLQVRLENHTTSSIAAFSLIVLTIVGFIAPFLAIFVTVGSDARDILSNLDESVFQIARIERRIEELTGQEVDLAAQITGSTEQLGTILFQRSTEVISLVTFHIIGIALTLFLVYYFLKSRDDLVDWIYYTVPLSRDVQHDLYGEINDVMWGVFFGHVFVAVVQGIVAGLGFVATGIPNPVFWTAVMVVLAMVPLIGAIPVWGGGVVYLYLSGEPILALGLFVYSVIVVGATDDYLRPFAVDRYARLSPAVILVGILGGAYAFGIMGLFFGPVVLGALKATLGVVADNWEHLDKAEGT